MTNKEKHGLHRRDAYWLIFWFVATLAECSRLTSGRQFWSDEIFGWMLARDPSLHHMVAAWRIGADGGGILFYLIARTWLHLFGQSAMALRFLNASAMGLGIAFAWGAARRWYRLEVVAIAIPLCWFTAHSVLQQLAIGRFYGPLIAAVAAAVYTFAWTAHSTAPKTSHLVATFAAHTFLVGIHPFGLVFSAPILTATFLADLAHHRFRPALYLAGVAGWWMLIPSRAAMLASAAVGKPHFWTTTPIPADLIDALIFWTDQILYLGLFLIFALLLRFALQHSREASKPSVPSTGDRDAILAGFALIAVIPALWLVSQRGTSFFADRYLTPTIVGAALLLCATLQRLIPAQRTPWQNWLLAFAVCATFGGTIYGAVWDMPAFFVLPPHAYTSAMSSQLPRDLPVVVERVDVFAESRVLEPQVQLRYLLDWDTAVDPAAPRGDVSGYHEMENWKRAGYYASSIQDSAAFLSSTPDFLVVSDPDKLWFTRRIKSDPAFVIDRVGTFRREKDTETIWRVHRIERVPSAGR